MTPPTILATSQSKFDTQSGCAGGGPTPTKVNSEPEPRASGWMALRFWSEMVHDAQLSRVAMGNRAGRSDLDPDIYKPFLAAARATEDHAKAQLRRTFKKVVPAELVAFQKETPGVGVDLFGRLLGRLGDPYIASPVRWMDTAPEGHVCNPSYCGKRHLVRGESYVRQVSELWSYCGHGDVTRKKRRGMSQEDAYALGSPTLKMVLWNISVCATKEGGRSLEALLAGEQSPDDAKWPYRRVWELRRLQTVDRGWTPGHAQADALRIVGKELLRHLWLTRHATSQDKFDTQATCAGGTPLPGGRSNCEARRISAVGGTSERAA